MTLEGELLRHIGKKPLTLQYPYGPRRPVRGLRGRPQIDMTECIGCGACARGCPAFAIEMKGKGRDVELRIHLDRCLFCGQCAESCPKEAMQLTTEYELAATERLDLVLEFKRPTPRS